MILYYLPNVTDTPTAALLEEYGIAARFEANPTLRRAQGPDGKHGTVVAQAVDATRVGHFPGEQVWHPIENENPERAYWLGWFAENRPGPQNLLRENPLGGRPIELNDGNKWLVPAARLAPSVYKHAKGEWRNEVDAAYAWMWPAAVEFYNRARNGSVEETDEGTVILQFETTPADLDIATRLLGLNYRVGPAEVSALDLLTDRNLFEVCAALVDPRDDILPYLRNEPPDEKKKT